MTGARWIWFWVRNRDGSVQQGWLDQNRQLTARERDALLAGWSGVGQTNLRGESVQARALFWCEYIGPGFGPWHQVPLPLQVGAAELGRSSPYG